MRRRPTVTSVHNDWLTLVEPVGAFLTLPVLKRVLPNGVPPVDADLRGEVRSRLDALAQEPGGTGDVAARTAWLEFLLREVLGWDPRLRQGAGVPTAMRHFVAEHGATLRPDYALVDVEDERERTHAVVFRWPLRTPLAERPARDEHGRPTRWAASPIERAALFCRAVRVPLALVTDTDRVALVWAPVNAPSGHATFATSLFAEERRLLDAFVAVLGLRRFFGVAEADTLPALLRESADAQHEVTTQLGKQVRGAVEVLIAAFSRADRASGGSLLRDVTPREAYQAAVTVMMRMVVLLSAEERRLFPVDDPLYADAYAVTTLRERLDAEARRDGEEVLEKRSSAWLRLLATFRAVHGGIPHDRLRLPAYGGSLFDPARFPWLADLAVDDRTVLAVLDALQVLTFRMGGVTEARRLSYRNLDVEQIGNVYEGLLDHDCQRIDPRTGSIVLGLVGRKHEEPELSLEEIERQFAKGEQAFAAWLEEQGGPSASKTSKLLYEELDPDADARLRAACDNDEAVYRRVRPFAGLIRDDARDLPMVFLPGALYVTQTSLRRDSGTAYTTKELADEVVRHTLEPLVYAPGPADTGDRVAWRLKPARDLLALRVCDPAVGSGAILVAACRFLADRLVEAWEAERSPALAGLSGDDAVLLARRTVTDHCLYGVDRNPMAVEMAKLSLWLTTLAKERPFTFLDHQVRCGDSLLGVTSLEQLRAFHIDPSKGSNASGGLFPRSAIDAVVDRGLAAARELHAIDVVTVRDAEDKARLQARMLDALRPLSVVADAIVGAALAASAPGAKAAVEDLLGRVSGEVQRALDPGTPDAAREAALADVQAEAAFWLDEGRPARAPERQPFHWPLAFPEVFVGSEGTGAAPGAPERSATVSGAGPQAPSPKPQAPSGFDAFIGNPPFMGGQHLTGTLGPGFREFLVQHVGGGRRGSADLVSYFFLRAFSLLREGGCFGFLATNTIAQGDTREVGLEQIVARGGVIHRAIPSREWPGAAAVHVAQVWVRKGAWAGTHDLDGRIVRGVTPFLVARSRVEGTPYRLKTNEGKSFQGSNVLGLGFTMTPDDAAALIAKDPRNRDVLFPYLNGEDLNSRPDQSPSRWVINFRDWPLDREARGSWATADEAQRKAWRQAGSVPADYPDPVASDYPDCLDIVRRLVKPEREANTYSAAARRYWWRFERSRPELYATIAGMDRVLCCAQTSNKWAPAFQPLGVVYSHTVVVFPLTHFFEYALMQSVLHEHWRLKYGASLKQDARYTPSDCFETFPFPECFAGGADRLEPGAGSLEPATDSLAPGTDSLAPRARSLEPGAWGQVRDALDDVGRRYHEHRQSIMRARNEGLTKTYNRFHATAEVSADIVELRRLHVEMDLAVLRAYGWDDLALDHGFHETKQGLRYTVSPDARQELLDRLLELNHQRYAAEVAAGLHGKAGGKGGRKTAKGTGGERLF